MSGPVLLVVENVGTLSIEEYFHHEAKFEIWHGKVTCGIVALVVANKRGESFGRNFLGGEEMTFMRYAVLSTWLYPYMVMVGMIVDKCTLDYADDADNCTNDSADDADLFEVPLHNPIDQKAPLQ